MAQQRVTVTPTPAPTPLSAESPWDESTRPEPGDGQPRTYPPAKAGAPQHLIDIHDHLRSELEQVRDLARQVREGAKDVGAARSELHEMSIRQNSWTLGAYCQSYCRIVTGHHGLEDRSVFPHLRRADPTLAPVLDRLEAEHLVIHDLLNEIDRALVTLVTDGPEGLGQLDAVVDLFTDALLSHLSYEERQLVDALAEHSFY
ncbi:MAG TPA: hemerythrin domain-containing protein [Propionibacteriaceae bacterium]|nr:hemerythrin domain-containing protein [Propionibacteriaceae bacterium]HPZ49668.1 hemerythrin domain-containing protein [Propionibacteriaceae bacterium]HQE30450.1 hemerythrin domain-containing protein [Propionibacteriaceae bacterium]